MNNKELLELASKAVGYDELPIEGWTTDSTKGMRLVGTDHEFVRYWNPLDDDGDALRLAVKLKFLIDVDGFFCTTVTDGAADQCELHNGEPEVATRLAIVKAAAESGKSMKVN